MPALVDRLRALPRAERLERYRNLAPGTLAALRYSPRFWGRDEQQTKPLEQLATIEVYRGGRRTGKTQSATWQFNELILSGKAKLPRVIAATDAAVESTVVNGPSGLRTWLPPHQRPIYTKSSGYAGELYYPTVGVTVMCCSAQRPGQAIGVGRDLTLADDPAGWVEMCGENVAAATFRQARVSNSEGPHPIMLVPTTRRGVSFLRQLLTPGQMRGVNIRRLGDTRANTNLSEAYRRDVIAELEGDDWGAEELLDEDRDEAPGALWKRAWIDHVPAAPELVRVVVSVDPADDGKQHSDETGIVVVGLGIDGRLYVLADYTARWQAEHWAAICAWAFREFKADGICAEMNRARSLVRRCLAIEAPNVPIIEVDATRGKATRAEPLSLLYRDGYASHVVDGPQLCRPGHVWIKVPVFDPATRTSVEVELEVERDRRGWTTLEDELCGWVPGTSRSPNGLDALVWGCWHLKPPVAVTEWTPVPPAVLAGRYAGVDPRVRALPPPAATPNRRPMRPAYR